MELIRKSDSEQIPQIDIYELLKYLSQMKTEKNRAKIR